jgi:hypothetical protein
MARPTSVPHHEVDAKLHSVARQKAATLTVSLSEVAVAGMRSYAADCDAAMIADAAERAAGRMKRTATRLPRPIADTLVGYASTHDDCFVPYMTALREAGWPSDAIAAELHMSGQAVQQRVARFQKSGKPVPDDMPTVESRHARSRDDLFDWSIYVPRDLYVLTTLEAARRGHSVVFVMEQILKDFVSGALTVAEKHSEHPKKAAA